MRNLLLIPMAIPAALLLGGCEILKDWDDDDQVSIEKTIEFQPGADEGVDANIFSCQACNYHTRNFGDSKEFSAIATTNGDISKSRALMYFDLSAIPEGATITSATLSLFYAHSDANGDHRSAWGSNSCKLMRITSPWTENGVTWAAQPTVASMNQVILPASTSDTQDYPNINVTALIADMVKDHSKNYGMMLRLQTEEVYRQLIFASSDHPDATKHPRLVVKYKKSFNSNSIK